MTYSHRVLTLALAASIAIASVPASAAGMAVFDTANYAQNLLQAARTLDQINNQVKSLQNEASMLSGMARNLEKLDFPQLRQITQAMERIDRLMGEAQSIGFKVDGLDGRIRALFPGELQQALRGDQQVALARARLDAAMSGFRQSMGVQAQVAENVREDASLLATLSAGSEGAVGALQAAQAANQLLALGVKQQLQLQNLMAAEYREAAIERARRAQGEADGRAATRRFLGTEASAAR
jgi:P-type conjugative transfer protein TrbJ